MLRWLPFVLLLAAQDPAPNVGDLIQKLRSEDIAEREAAVRRLKETGSAARPGLEKAAADPDREVATRARQILRFLDLKAGLSPALLREFPGLEYKLEGTDEHPWTEAFLEATAQKGIRRSHPALGRADVEPLAARALNAARPEEWETVLPRISAWRIRSVAPEIVRFLDVVDPRSSRGGWEAHVALRSLCVPEVVPKVLELARTTQNSTWKSGLLETAILLDPKAAVKDFFAILYDRDPQQATASSISAPLKELDVVEAIPFLVAMIRDSQPGLQSLAVEALLELDPALALREIEKQLEKIDPRNPQATVAVLEPVRRPEGVPLLTKLAGHPSPLLRSMAATNLGTAGAKEAIPLLRSLLKDGAEEVRKCALRALALLKDRESIPEFLKQAREPNDYGRVIYLGALARLQVREIIPDLRRLLREKGKDSSLLSAAVYALRELKDRDSIADMAPLLDLPPDNHHIGARSGALYAIVDLGGKEALPIVRKCLKDDDSQIQSHAVSYLGFLLGKDAVPELLGILRDKDHPSRWAALQALEAIGGEEIRRELLRVLKEEDLENELAALVGILGRMGAPEALAEFRVLLTHPMEWVRTSAAEALCRNGVRDGAGLLVEGWSTPLPVLSLNALRSPELWARLGREKPKAKLEGAAFEVLQAAAKEAGLILEGPLERISRTAGFPPGPFSFEGVTYLEILRQVLPWRYGIVFENDRLRLLGERETKLFWKAWWADECLRSANPEDRKEGERLRRAVKSEEARRAEIVKAVRDREAAGEAPGANPGELARALTPALRAIPGLVDRLAAGEDSTWTEVFLETQRPDHWKIYRRLKAEDFELLWPRALRGASTPPKIEQVLMVIGQRRIVAARAALGKLLGDRITTVRIAALRALAMIAAREDIPAVAALLESSNATEAQAALGALHAMEAREHAPTILALAREGPPGTRLAAAEVLAKWKTAEALPIVSQLSKSPDYITRRSAAFALGNFEGPDVGPAMRELLKDEDSMVVYVGLSYAEWNGFRESIPEIVGILDRQGALGWMSANYAMSALDTMGAREAIPKARALLKSPDRHLGARAAEFLADMKVTDAIPELRKILEKGQDHEYSVAIPALVEFGDRDCVPQLYRLLKTGDWGARRAAAEALVALEGRAALPALREAMKDKGDGSLSLVEWLVPLSPEEALPALLERKEWGDALAGLIKLRRPEAKPTVEKWLDESSASLRAHALKCLYELEGRTALPLVREALQDPDIREDAALLLVRAGERDVVPLLLQSKKSLFALNALRAPALWQRLSEITLAEHVYGNSREILEWVAKKTDLKLVGPREDAKNYVRWNGYYKRFGSRLKPVPLLEALEQLPWVVVFDQGVLRAIPHEDAPKFWAAWWESVKDRK